MLRSPYSLLWGFLLPVLLSGCGASSSSSTEGAATAPTVSPTTGTTTPVSVNLGGSTALSGTDDLVVATPSQSTLAVVVGASRTVGITFTSSDARAMTGFAISAASNALPAGWSAPAAFHCTMVSTGSGCVFNLTYTPVAVASGTVTIDYVVVDNAGIPRTDGEASIAYSATSSNNVVATASPTGQINAVAGAGTQHVSLNFITDDGNAATGFAVTTDLTALPTGWTAMAPSLSCAIVSTGNGCQIVLTYAPQMGASGTVTVAYSYTDDSGTPKTGAIDIPYFTTSANTVVANATPAGEIIAAQKGGGQSVPVTFTTDDGKPASALAVTSKLSALPAGWTSGSTNFNCAIVSTGNGCQLILNFAPATLVSGTVPLTYTYVDGSGATASGELNIDYAATTNDNVVGTPTPTGQINAVVGDAAQPVAVMFTTDDGRSATALQLTSSLGALPPGWSSASTAFACSGLDADNACQLNLSYAPSAAASGMLTLNYSYLNNAEESKTGTVNVAYGATTNDNIIATPAPASLSVVTGTSTAVAVTFTTDDGNPASNLSLGAALATLPQGWTSSANVFTCASVSSGSTCVLPLTYAPSVVDSGTLNLGFSYASNSGSMQTGMLSIIYSAGP